MLHGIISIMSDVFWTVAPPLGAVGVAVIGADVIAGRKRRAEKRRKCREEWLRWEVTYEAAKQAKKAAG